MVCTCRDKAVVTAASLAVKTFSTHVRILCVLCVYPLAAPVQGPCVMKEEQENMAGAYSLLNCDISFCNLYGNHVIV